MAKPYKIGLIGCGLRGAYYLYNLKMANLDFSLKAMADPDSKYPDVLNQLFADGKAAVFQEGEELIKNLGSELDAVIIASPNYVHHGPMVLAVNKHLKVLLEKPVACTIEDMATMWEAYNVNDGKIVIGFCLRYTPFYRKVKEIVESGRLGQILQINAEELMSDELSMVFPEEIGDPVVNVPEV